MNANAAVYVLLPLLFAGAGCGGNRLPQNDDIQRQAALASFKNCSDLEGYIKDVAVKYMRSQLEQEKRGWFVWPAVLSGGTPSTMDAGAARNSAGPTAYTQTNTQVAGVDEADIVKTDGTRIFTLAGGQTLYIARSWPANQLAQASKVKFDEWARDMFLVSNSSDPSAPASTAIVFSQIYGAYPAGTGNAGSAIPCRYAGPGSCLGSTPTTKITVLDVSDEANPRGLGEYYLPGYYNTSRRIGSSVRVVSNDSFRYPDGVKWYPDLPPNAYNDLAQLAAAFDALMDQNEKVIRSASLDSFLPDVRHVLPDGTVKILPYQCTDFSRTNAPTLLGFVTVSTIDLTTDNITRSTILAQASQVYASLRSLYVATAHWWWWPQPGQQSFTYLHQFDITQPDRARYVRSGGVAGNIADQFSIDEDARGNLRAATTLSTLVADPQSPWGRLKTANRISVLAPQAGQLQSVGQTDDFLPDERIFGTRFVGNKGYVVTFHQVDPLSIFDLGDPAHPHKVGELQVPGYSTYLHPLDDNHLLAIGEYIPPNNQWNARSIQLSLFDVTDPANPVRSFNQLVGTSSAYSEAQYDHKAFTYFAEKGLLAIPFFDWNAQAVGPAYWDNFVSGVRVFGVDVSQGISDKGILSMRDVYQTFNYNNWSWRWAPMARRAVMASSSTDVFVYGISDAGIRVANLNALSSPIATALFEVPPN